MRLDVLSPALLDDRAIDARSHDLNMSRYENTSDILEEVLGALTLCFRFTL